jgi:Acetyltransferase (GNAT) domain
MQKESATLESSPNKFEVIPLTTDRYADWDAFCLKSPDAWYWHTTQWLEYSLHYRPELQPRSESFLCLLNGEIAALCPLITETYANGEPMTEFSFGGDAVPAPAFAEELSHKDRKAVVKLVFAHIDARAEAQRVGRASFRVSSVAPSFWSYQFPQANPLVRLGFNDISLVTQVLDLEGDEPQLLRDMRKGHRADIARAAKLMQAEVLDQMNITQQRFDSYRLLHHKAAGRVTRPLETFQMMLEWIRAGQAILCAATLEGRDVGFALVSVYKDGAYYSSSCEDPEYNDLPIGHLLQWRAMQWLKQHGIRRYEIGVQPFSDQVHSPTSEKELKIGFFKRGFGGQSVAFWRGEKFYNQDYCLRVLQERAKKYAQNAVAAKEHGVSLV